MPRATCHGMTSITLTSCVSNSRNSRGQSVPRQSSGEIPLVLKDSILTSPRNSRVLSPHLPVARLTAAPVQVRPTMYQMDSVIFMFVPFVFITSVLPSPTLIKIVVPSSIRGSPGTRSRGLGSRPTIASQTQTPRSPPPGLGRLPPQHRYTPL